MQFRISQRLLVRATRKISTGTECVLERLQNNDAGIVMLTLNRPKAKNALGTNLLSEFRTHLQSLRNDSNARVVILNSAVSGVFCAGADLKERAKMTPAEVSSFVHDLRASFTEFEDLPIPTIAAIDGFALGGGFELALGADMRVVGENAKVGFPETNLAIIPGAGGTQRLPRLIGISKAKELIFTGAILNSEKAFQYGMVNKAVSGSAIPASLDLARSMLNKGPIALQMAKLAINRGSQLDLTNGMAFEKACYAQVIPTQDRLEGLAAFKEKRTPVYKGC
ncbi:ClpP/crotonase-like domain-containing protein [Globomyces pollinis-pini]|nr:ClpP/crotonase-like domain-containing protein [Globomyces pollinis-pini]